MPPVIVYSAYFANTRCTSEATSEALELAYKILQRSQDSEKECSGWDFIAKGSRFVKVFTSKCPYEHDMVGLLMDREIHSRLDELWIVLTKGHFPEPFDDQNSDASSEAKIRGMKQRFRGTPSFNTDPSSDNDNYLSVMKQMVEIHMKHLGYALRFHNEHHPHDQIVLQDVMKDVIAFGTERARKEGVLPKIISCAY